MFHDDEKMFTWNSSYLSFSFYFPPNRFFSQEIQIHFNFSFSLSLCIIFLCTKFFFCGHQTLIEILTTNLVRLRTESKTASEPSTVVHQVFIPFHKSCGKLMKMRQRNYFKSDMDFVCIRVCLFVCVRAARAYMFTDKRKPILPHRAFY